MKKTKAQPTRSRFTILRQLCDLIPAHLVPKLARDCGVWWVGRNRQGMVCDLLDDRSGAVAIVEAIRCLEGRIWNETVGHRRIVLLFTAQGEVRMRGTKYLSKFQPHVFNNVAISLSIDGPIDLRSRYPEHAFIAVVSPSDVRRSPYARC
ncbi:MAG: hypothetical protein CMO80_13895 [Verrucomicrobiales bacterium]|nr:hypothetical protein [Verrucomicrobiales bacterium]